MTREEKCKLAIEKGFTYNPETGEVISPKGKIFKANCNGYINIGLSDDNKKQYFIYAHQFAWYWVNKECNNYIDHINGIRDDNRISNLRGVTNQQNLFNQTKAKGYCWNKRDNKWNAQIGLNGKLINLGRFDTKEEAHNAYLAAKEQYHKF